MIYYHFGGKKQLYIAVLERAYARIRAAEQQVNVDHLDPVDRGAPHRRGHLRPPRGPPGLHPAGQHRERPPRRARQGAGRDGRPGHAGHPACSTTSSRAGRASGVFRADVDAIDVHMMISAFCVFRVANRHTFGAIFGRDLVDPARHDHYRTMCGDMIVRYLAAGPVPKARSRKPA